MRTALLLDITQRVVVIPYRRFGTTYLSHFQGTLKMEPIGCPETSVRNFHYSLRNNPEQCCFHEVSLLEMKMKNRKYKHCKFIRLLLTYACLTIMVLVGMLHAT